MSGKRDRFEDLVSEAEGLRLEVKDSDLGQESKMRIVGYINSVISGLRDIESSGEMGDGVMLDVANDDFLDDVQSMIEEARNRLEKHE